MLAKFFKRQSLENYTFLTPNRQTWRLNNHAPLKSDFQEGFLTAIQDTLVPYTLPTAPEAQSVALYGPAWPPPPAELYGHIKGRQCDPLVREANLMHLGSNAEGKEACVG